MPAQWFLVEMSHYPPAAAGASERADSTPVLAHSPKKELAAGNKLADEGKAGGNLADYKR